jgi:hypothetical protein
VAKAADLAEAKAVVAVRVAKVVRHARVLPPTPLRAMKMCVTTLQKVTSRLPPFDFA